MHQCKNHRTMEEVFHQDLLSKVASSDEDSPLPGSEGEICLAPVTDMDKLLEFHKSGSFCQAQLVLREYVARFGIHGESMSPPTDALRTKIWKVLLGVPCYFEVDPYVLRSEVNKRSLLILFFNFVLMILKI